MKNYVRSNKGSALPAVLLIMLIVTALSGAAVSLVVSQTKEEGYYENNISAFHVAEAGLNQYLWHLNKIDSTPIALETVINYPEDKPVAAYKLAIIQDGANKKTIQATGWMLNDTSVIRMVTTTFEKRSLAQFIYFSDNDGDNIWWMNSDNCYGPYHTNSVLRSNGHPNFWGKATSVEGIIYADNKEAANKPNFHKGYEKVAAIKMQDDNKELMYWGKPNNKGYYYTGRTSILLNNNGTITVWNEHHSPKIETLPLPESGVIYVNEMDGYNYNDKFDLENGNVFISGVLNGRLTVGAKHDIFITGYDPTQKSFSSAAVTNGITYKDATFSLDTTTGAVKCDDKDMEMEGDMLGLVAEQNVAVLARGWFDNGDRDSSRKNFNVYAAVMAIHKSFINSTFMSGNDIYPSDPGTLTVRGSIVQNTRGGVGTISNGVISKGYKKDYAHDPRMEYDEPPHFLAPENSGWEITDWDEIN